MRKKMYWIGLGCDSEVRILSDYLMNKHAKNKMNI